MKKVLFASTALVASAGFAAADITFSGGANFGIGYTEGAANETVVKNEIDFNIIGSGESDGGVLFGASMDIDGAFKNGATTQAVSNDPEVYIEVSGLRLSVGAVSGANDNQGLADVGFDGIGIDDVAEVSANSSADVLVTYSFSDFGVAASVNSSNDDWAVGIDGSVSDFSFALGFGEAGNTDEMNVFAAYATGALTVGAQYSESGSTDGWGLHAIYTQGDLTLTAVYAESGAADAYGIGASYDLGGGLSVAGGFGEAGGVSVADFGVNMKF